MLKKYELTERHFDNYEEVQFPTEEEIFTYNLERELRAQGIVAIESTMSLTYKADKLKMEKIVRAQEKDELLIQQWTWMIKKPPHKIKNQIADRIGDFEKFQLSR